MKRCAKQGCGSYAFNLHQDGIDQVDLCDVHYWQSHSERLQAELARVKAERDALKVEVINRGDYWLVEWTKSRAELRELRQQIAEAKPVAWVDDGGKVFWHGKAPKDDTDLYLHPPLRRRAATCREGVSDDE